MIPIDRGRVAASPSLVTNGERWGRELCERRRTWHADGKPGNRPDADSGRYRAADVKAALEALVGKKCHYCEARIRRYDVEHFRPQSLYPLLAFTWSNLLLACQICNQNYKKDQFPLEPNGQQAEEDPDDPSRANGSDDARLINPLETDPTEHLTFRDGRILGKTLRGRTTIRVCGLKDADLVDERRGHHIAIAAIIGSYRRARQNDDQEEVTRLGDALMRLSRDRALFAGMVRAELARHGYDWEALA